MIPANIVAVVLMGCPTTQVTNHTNDWTQQDGAALEQATKRCPEKFDNSPCLKSFEKMEEGVYRAICGAKSEN